MLLFLQIVRSIIFRACVLSQNLWVIVSPMLWSICTHSTINTHVCIYLSSTPCVSPFLSPYSTILAKATAFQTMTAGLCAGVCEAVIAVTPTETLKTRLIHDRNQPVPRYQGLVHATRTIIAEEGIQGMYRGLVPTMLKQGCNQASRFAVYTAIVNALRSRPRKSVIATPEGISSDFTSSLSVPTAAQEAAADSGIAALPATSSSTSSTSSADSSSPSSSSSSTLSSHPTHTPPPSAHATESASKPSPPTNTTASTTSTGKTARVNPWSSLAAGATAGFVSVYITMPFDIVKVRDQAYLVSGLFTCLLRSVIEGHSAMHFSPISFRSPLLPPSLYLPRSPLPLHLFPL